MPIDRSAASADRTNLRQTVGVAVMLAGALTLIALSAHAQTVGEEGMPSVEHIDRADRADRDNPRFTGRRVASRRVSAQRRSVDEIARFKAAQQESMVPGRPLLIGSVRSLPQRERDVQGNRLAWDSVPGGHAAVLEYHAERRARVAPGVSPFRAFARCEIALCRFGQAR